MASKRSPSQSLAITLQGKRFRAERNRLDLSIEDVASICRSSASAVFAWESGRSRIPLIAAELLWDKGFDVENVIAGEPMLTEIPAYPLKEGPKVSVPKHMLARYSLDASLSLAYHNQVAAEGLYPAGVLLALRWVPESDKVVLEEEDQVLLLEPKGTKPEFICRSVPSRKGSVKLMLGDYSVTVKSSCVLDRCRMIGEPMFQIGLLEPTEKASRSHKRRLKELF